MNQTIWQDSNGKKVTFRILAKTPNHSSFEELHPLFKRHTLNATTLNATSASKFLDKTLLGRSAKLIAIDE
ncbi:hypothetical protein [Vibrio renipiscarius]|uniref:hypothetical protein n=1 Tax=Vibrio renipiscarius TaxID=1461322 RepID=UPI00126A0E5C|nr:hypothetical protein [Vibrio renipiscarius]